MLMKNTLHKYLFPVCAVAVLGLTACAHRGQGDNTLVAVTGQAQPSVVKVVKTVAGGYQLQRNGQPYFIKGAGGGGSKPDLKAAGANSWRTWGADNLDGQLAEAQALGMTVTVGIWLGQKAQGFHYDDAAAVARQKETARQAILKYRNSPALLVWALGNEMENGDQDDVAMWNAIEDIAKMVHQLDPNHPAMTVFAEVGGDKIANLNKYCPDIDIVGINSYAGGPSVGDRYKAAGGVKPYILTEFGPPGTWEIGKNAWGAAPEPTSTEKAQFYRATYEKAIENQPLSLGSYAFTWGNKQEATATWFGLLLPDGSRLGAVDALTQLWTGQAPAHPVPAIRRLSVPEPARVDPGTTVQAALDVTSPDGDPLTVQWVLQGDAVAYHTGGGAETATALFPDSIVHSDAHGAQVKMPNAGGGYRLFAYVHDTHGGAAVANVPLFVTGSQAFQAPSGKKATLPLVVYGTGRQAELPYTPAGYMGNAGAIKMDDASPDDPHSGSTCLKAIYTAGDSWGGVVWQSPANDWGDQPGGWDLTGAKKLTFWARGDGGGEVVSFSYGLLGKDKVYSDTGTGKLANVALTKDWKQYSIDLTGQDLSRIKTGFAWVVAASGKGVVFYLDDIRYE